MSIRLFPEKRKWQLNIFKFAAEMARCNIENNPR